VTHRPTDEHEHDGPRVSDGAVPGRLIDMVRGRVQQFF
jgi:hypothetical protein